MAKNKVTPLKQLTIPRLELSAAVLGARLCDHILSNINCKQVFLWSDSQIVLSWISSEKPQKAFIDNRVKEIREMTSSYQWRYCPTDSNPADLLSRGMTFNQFERSTLWKSGPEWLVNTDEWPKPFSTNMHSMDLEPSDSVFTGNTNVETSQVPGIRDIVDIERFSSIGKLLRVSAYVTRFVNNCKSRDQQRRRGPLQVTELQQVEMLWIRACQQSSFSEEIVNMNGNGNRLSLVKQLRLFIDECELVRCGGRIHNAPIDEQARFPYLLPARHLFTTLVIREAHETQLHAGINATVTYIRQKYWIPTLRQRVRTIIRKCVRCRKVTGQPYKTPPPLPHTRVTNTPPFTITGVDFSGALYVKAKSGQESKAYVCLFTCATTRAVHLELVPDLTEETFLQAFRRFTSRRPVPTVLISDNATTYMAAAEHIRRLFDSPTIKQSFGRQGIQWKFIPKRAPWYGGWWERLIGLTKVTLKKVLGRAFVSYESLHTILTEIEAQLNDRPLTYVGSSPEDPDPLTPAHLLYGRRLTSMPYPDDPAHMIQRATTVTSDDSSITKRAKVQKQLIDNLRERWKSEYLTSLREHHRSSGNNVQTISEGDVVQIHDESPRSRWRLARIHRVIRGKDGLIRAAEIRTDSGVTTRPIAKLYPLEVLNDSK